MAGKTLYDKLWADHVVHTEDDGSCLIYIDRHLVHEVTSPQAFEGLRLANRLPWRVSRNLAVADHNVPTNHRDRGIEDPISRLQVETLDKNCAEFGITEFGMNDIRQGIVHVIGPEQGATLPGMTVVCGDSHTSTHGASGALAFGIGTSEVEHVLATQCLVQKKAKNLLISVNGQVGAGVTAKDIVLAIIGQIGTAGGNGYTIEFGGSAIRALSMEGRTTATNTALAPLRFSTPSPAGSNGNSSTAPHPYDYFSSRMRIYSDRMYPDDSTGPFNPKSASPLGYLPYSLKAIEVSITILTPDGSKELRGLQQIKGTAKLSDQADFRRIVYQYGRNYTRYIRLLGNGG